MSRAELSPRPKGSHVVGGPETVRRRRGPLWERGGGVERHGEREVLRREAPLNQDRDGQETGGGVGPGVLCEWDRHEGRGLTLPDPSSDRHPSSRREVLPKV